MAQEIAPEGKMEIITVVSVTLELLLGLFVFSVCTPSGPVPVRRRKP